MNHVMNVNNLINLKKRCKNMIYIEAKEVHSVTIHYGFTWVWLRGKNTFIPTKRGKYSTYHMLYKYDNTYICAPLDTDTYNLR